MSFFDSYLQEYFISGLWPNEVIINPSFEFSHERNKQQEMTTSHYNLRPRTQGLITPQTATSQVSRRKNVKNITRTKSPKPQDDPASVHKENKIDNNTNTVNKESNSCSILTILLFSISIFLILFFIIWSLYFKLPAEQKFVKNVNIEQFKNEILKLDTEFVNQSSNLWFNVISGMKDYYRTIPQQPFVIMLVDNENFKSDTTECLAQVLATKIIVSFSGSKSARPMILEASTLQRDEFGDLMEELNSIVISRKVLVINNIQELPGSMALSLFSLCDRYNPAVKDAILIFTLHEIYPSNSSSSIQVEKILNDAWRTHVPQDKLPALITRVTSRVVTVNSERTQMCFT